MKPRKLPRHLLDDALSAVPFFSTKIDLVSHIAYLEEQVKKLRAQVRLLKEGGKESVKLLTCDDVERQLTEIEKAARLGDDRYATVLEQDLYRSVLLSIAKGAPRSQSLARRAIKSMAVCFKRSH